MAFADLASLSILARIKEDILDSLIGLFNRLVERLIERDPMAISTVLAVVALAAITGYSYYLEKRAKGEEVKADQAGSSP